MTSLIAYSDFRIKRISSRCSSVAWKVIYLMLQKRKEGCIRGANSMEEFVKVVMKLLNST